MTNPQQPSLPDRWASGIPYEFYVGRWSRLVAQEFLTWLSIPPNSRWLDVGCGTGALTHTILQQAQPATVKGLDRSEGFIAHARSTITDPRASFDVADAQSLPELSDSYDAIVSGLVLNFIPQPLQALREMARVVRPNGVIAIYVWDYAGEMQFMRHFWNAAVALDPAAADLDEGSRFPLCQPEPLTQLFRDAGLTDIEVRPIDIPTHFKDFNDYWEPFLGGQGSAPTYVSSLTEAQRIALRDHLRATLPFAPNGSLPLIARAWAVRGIS
jgi:SAM-dependent methyltransferase